MKVGWRRCVQRIRGRSTEPVSTYLVKSTPLKLLAEVLLHRFGLALLSSDSGGVRSGGPFARSGITWRGFTARTRPGTLGGRRPPTGFDCRHRRVSVDATYMEPAFDAELRVIRIEKEAPWTLLHVGPPVLVEQPSLPVVETISDRMIIY